MSSHSSENPALQVSSARSTGGETPAGLSSFPWWWAFGRVLGSIEALREWRVLYLLLCAFTGAGLTVSLAQASFARGDTLAAILESAAALFIAFYGTNAAGLMLMDQARGVPIRHVVDAVRDALGLGHRVLVLVLSSVTVAGLVLSALVGLMWLARAPWVGTSLFAVLVPLTVLVLAALMLLGAAVVGPMSGPIVWAGASSRQGLRELAQFGRHRWVQASVLMVALSLSTALVGAAVSFAVVVAGRVMAEVSVRVIGVNLDPVWLMAGLFGRGLQGAALQGVDTASLTYLSAGMLGGGVVFVTALVLPTMVYLRGVCEIHRVLSRRRQADAEAGA